MHRLNVLVFHVRNVCLLLMFSMALVYSRCTFLYRGSAAEKDTHYLQHLIWRHFFYKCRQIRSPCLRVRNPSPHGQHSHTLTPRGNQFESVGVAFVYLVEMPFCPFKNALLYPLTKMPVFKMPFFKREF